MKEKWCFVLIFVLAILLSVTSCFSEKKTPEQIEVESVAEYLISNSGSDKAEIYASNYNANYNLVSIFIMGINDLECVDNVAFAMNQYLTDNPDSFLNSRVYIDIHFCNHTSLNQIDNDYMIVSSNSTGGSTESEIRCLSVYASKPFSFSEFTKCRTMYNCIEFSQAVYIDDISVFTELDSLEQIYLCEIPDTANLDEYNLEAVDYETYKVYCKQFNQLNAERKCDFAHIILSPPDKEEEWKTTYGESFVSLVDY